MAREQPRKIAYTTYFEGTPEGARELDRFPWFPVLLGLIAVVVVGGALLALLG